MALGRNLVSRQLWLVASDEPALLQTFREHGERFQIEEELLDEKSDSYFRIGWNWLKGCLHKDWALFPSIELQGGDDPAPAITSQKQAQQQSKREFTVQSYRFAA